MLIGAYRLKIASTLTQSALPVAFNLIFWIFRMLNRITVFGFFVLAISSCGGDAITTDGDAVGGPGVIVNRYDLNGNTEGTIEDGNPNDIFEFEGSFYKTRNSGQRSNVPTNVPLASVCYVPPYGSCLLRSPIPSKSPCYCTFPNGAYANGYAN